MKKLLIFIKEIIIRTLKNDLYTQANAMTFSMILAMCPILIVAIASLRFFDINFSNYIVGLVGAMPVEVRNIINDVVVDVFQTKHVSLLSTSAVIALYSASSGFVSMIRGINRMYNKDVNTGFIVTRILSIILVLIFILLIVISFILVFFGSTISNFLVSLGVKWFIPSFMHTIILSLLYVSIGVIYIIIIHKLAVDNSIPVKNIIPGAIFIIAAWLIASNVFVFCINNFYRYSLLYGSIGTIFVLTLWINIFCYVILIGSQINAILCDKNFMDKIKSI